MTDFTARIAAGMDLLDDQLLCWLEKVDLTTLELGSTCACVLGQTFGDFSAGTDIIGWNDEQVDSWIAAHYGFDLTEEEFSVRSIKTQPRYGSEAYSAWRIEIYAELTEAWRHAIVARRLAESKTLNRV